MKQFVKLQMSDLQKVVTFYNAIIDDSKESPYSPGWTKNIYPDKKLLSQLIAEKSMYGLKSFDKIFAAICLNNSCELESKKVNWNVNASENEVWFIHLLGVSKAEQGKGFGKKLIYEAENIAIKSGKKVLRLEVNERNLPAIKLYENTGFMYVDTVKIHYSSTGFIFLKLYQKNLIQ